MTDVAAKATCEAVVTGNDAACARLTPAGARAPCTREGLRWRGVVPTSTSTAPPFAVAGTLRVSDRSDAAGTALESNLASSLSGKAQGGVDPGAIAPALGPRP